MTGSPSRSPNNRVSDRGQRARKSPSQNQSASQEPSESPANGETCFSPAAGAGLFESGIIAIPGTINDAAMIRSLLTEVMKNCRLSRAEIADEMSRLTGTTVTERQLNNFSADSREEYRFPCELERAFCMATGDDRLLRCRVEAAGFHVIDDDELSLLDLGRQFLIRNQADEKVALLQRRLHGRFA